VIPGLQPVIRYTVRGIWLLSGCILPFFSAMSEAPTETPATTGSHASAPGAAASHPDIILISVDTLRADHLAPWGGDPTVAPAINTLAAQSIRFPDTLCDVPLTAPSFAAMFTGRPPLYHGLTRNGMHLPDGVPLVAEDLSRAGYHTVAVVGSWVLKARLCGLDRGFAIYDDHMERFRWGVALGERDAEQVTNAAIRYLAERPHARPLFLWVHYIDPHAPYRRHAGCTPPRPSEPESRKDRARRFYRGEITWMDRHIARLLHAVPESAVVVFIADHGENLGEHGYFGHGRQLWQASIRIPLFLRIPGRPPVDVDVPAMAHDLAPTLLALAGTGPLPRSEGFDLLNTPPPADRPRFIQSYPGAVTPLPGIRDFLDQQKPQLSGVVLGPYKWFADRHGRQARLFNLREDPDERYNLISGLPEHRSALESLTYTWLNSAQTIQNGGPSHLPGLTPADRAALRALGYL